MNDVFVRVYERRATKVNTPDSTESLADGPGSGGAGAAENVATGTPNAGGGVELAHVCPTRLV